MGVTETAGVSARALNKLTDKGIKKWQKERETGQAKVAMLSDGGGLRLTLSPKGTALWQVKYRRPLDGRESVFSPGPYPDVTLADARADRTWVKDQLREGRDPNVVKRLNRITTAVASGHTFEAVMNEWLELRRPKWSGIHSKKSRQALERDVTPTIGRLPIAEITPAMITAIVKAIAKRGASDTARKVLQHVSAIFRLAKANGLRSDNPADSSGEALPTVRKTDQSLRPALKTFKEIGAVLRDADLARLSPAVRMAHRLIAFTAGRISNVVEADWREFHFEEGPAKWVIPRAKMKSQRSTTDHTIFLGPTIAAELRAWRALVGSKGLVFRSPTDEKKHISRESLEKVYRVTLGLGDKHVPHGWRSALASLARDAGHERDVVEIALDHVHDTKVVMAYDRGERLEQRVKLMKWWDSELAKAERGADVLKIKRA